jgi:hypothetical protein
MTMSTRLVFDLPGAIVTDPQPGAPKATWRHRDFVADAELQEFGVALKTETVTFHEVARAWFALQDVREPEAKRALIEVYGKVLEAFEAPRGGIKSSYFCENLPIAAALTDIEKAAQRGGSAGHDRRGVGAWEQASGTAIHVEPLFGYPTDAQSKRLLARCLDLHYRALEFLPPKLRRICLRRIFSIIVALLGTLDQRAGATRGADDEAAPVAVELRPDEASELERQLDEVARGYKLTVKQRAQWDYFSGMNLLALPAISVYVVLALVGVISPTDPLAVSMLAGALGAMISVMRRISQDDLKLMPAIDRRMTWLLGSIRPVIGIVFGALTYVLIESGLLTGGTVPDIPTDRYLYYAGLAFAAGFTERVAHVLTPSDTTLGDIVDVAPDQGDQRESPTRSP